MDEQKNKHGSMNADPMTDKGLQGGNSSQEHTPREDTPMSTTPEAKPTTPVTPQSTDPVTSQNKSSALPIVIGVGIVLLLAAGAFFLMGQDGSSQPSDTNSGTNGQQTSAIDENSVVATVNGTDILGSDLTYQMAQVAQSSGIQDMSQLDQETLNAIQSQATDAIVNSEILRQDAIDQGLTVSEAEVEEELNAIIESVGGEDVANERLATLGLTQEEFREELEGDLLIQKYIDENVDTNALTVTEEEIQTFYDQVSAQQQGEAPPLADVRAQIEEQLQLQKQQEAMMGVLQELRDAADIEIF